MSPWENSAATTKRALGSLSLAVIVGTGTVSAQVGHDPSRSPYEDVRTSQALVLSAGYLAGSAGSAGVGPTNGVLAGARFEINIGGPGVAMLGASAANLDRLIIDPELGPETRIQGTVKQSVLLFDAGFLLVLTGKKTWRRLAPYVGASLGLALGGRVPADTVSGFTFSSNFHIGPHLGVRWHVSDRLSWRIEIRNVLWRLSYPPEFFSLPEDPVLDDPTKRREWAHHPSLSFAFGYAIRM